MTPPTKKAKDSGFLMDRELAEMLCADGVIEYDYQYYGYLDKAWDQEIRSIRAAK